MRALAARVIGADLSPRAWATIGIGFAVLSLSFSSRSSIGLIMPSLEAEFGATRSLISSAAALGFGVMAVLSVTSGVLVDRFGPTRVLPAGLACLAACFLALALVPSAPAFVAIYSIVGGIAFGTAAMQVVAAMVTRAVAEGRGFAMGLAASGSTAGQVLVIPALALIVAAWGWRPAYTALGLAAGAFALLAFLSLRRLDGASGGAHAPHGPHAAEQGYGFLGSFVFQALLWSYVICGFTTSGVIETHLIPYSLMCGYTEVQSATAFSVLSVVNLVGITLAGWLSDRIEKHWLLAAIYTIRAASFVLLMQIAGDYTTLLAFAFVFGASDYATIPVTIGLLAHYIGVQRMGVAMGVLAAGHALGGAAGAMMGGVMFDLFLSYSATWWASVAFAQLAAVLVLAVLFSGSGRPTVAMRASG